MRKMVPFILVYFNSFAYQNLPNKPILVKVYSFNTFFQVAFILRCIILSSFLERGNYVCRVSSSKLIYD